MRIDDVLQRIQGEFLEMPGLRLTAPQARGCGVSTARSAIRCLQSLVDVKFLQQTRDGAFVRLEGARAHAIWLRAISAVA